jgi:UDP-N-acetylglucosamine diphosphorylase/glucosamine-1-phosphate N-acetyltransferase
MLFLYDDARARGFEPIALTRPLGEARSGARLVRERWSYALQLPIAGFVAAEHLWEFEERDAPPAVSPDAVLPAGSIVVNTRCAPALAPLSPGTVSGRTVWICQARVGAVRLAADVPARLLADGRLTLESLVSSGARAEELPGWWMDDVWDLVRWLPEQLADDLRRLQDGPDAARFAPPPSHAITLGTHRVTLAAGATVEPQVVLDAQVGPIHLESGATVQAFTRLVGPCYVGHASIVSGDRVAGSAIGDGCRVRGEVSSTIFVGHANKAHDGFLGHSYVGRWVNLGASTVTSNLKNTYGTVALWTPAGLRDTGLQFLGTLFGDHAKTGIGSRLTTGAVVGAGASYFAAGMSPKVVPPFAWSGGAEGATYAFDKFLEVAARMMARRGIVLSDRMRRTLERAHAQRWTAG